MRSIPFTVFKFLLKAQNRHAPGMIYIQPLEVRADYSKMPLSILLRFIQYHRCGTALQTLVRLMDSFRFGSFQQT